MSDATVIELTEAQREKQPLLERFGIILAPSDIDDAAYTEMSWALHIGRVLHPDKALELRCYGSGGGTYAMLAIVNLIRADGRIDGVLVGDAGSSSSVIWAACAMRYVHPFASLNVHGTIDKGEGWNTPYLKANYETAAWLDAQIARIYAGVSTQPSDWWLDKMTAGHGNCTLMPADELIALGMARPIEERAA